MVVYLIAAAIFLTLALLQVLFKAKKPFKKAFGGIILGISTLVAVNIASIFTGVFIPVSLLSLGTAAVMGIPGVTMLLVLNLVL